MRFVCRFLIFACWFLLPLATGAFASPPYFTDDPYIAAFRNLQLYFYGTVNTTSNTKNIFLPAVQANYGLLPNLEFDITAAIYRSINPGLTGTGPGDSEVSVKWIFMREHEYWPAIAIAPALEVPTGDPHQDLGNGKFWYKLPIWFGKTWKRWVTTAGVGYGVNNAPHMSNYFFGGWDLQRIVTDKLTIGGEVFAQGTVSNLNVTPFQDSGAVTLVNFGAVYNFNPNSALLFSFGHSIAGVPQWNGFLGYFINLC